MKLDLKKSVDTVFQLADIIDQYDIGIRKISELTNSNLSSEYHSTKEIIKLELLQFLSKIVGVDGNISQSEVNFINRYLDLDFELTTENLKKVIKTSGILEDDTISLPLGVIIFKEADSKLREKKIIDENTGDIAEFLVNVYEILGKEALMIDDVIEDKEIAVYTKYTKYYKESLSTYIPIASNNSSDNIIFENDNAEVKNYDDDDKTLDELLNELNGLIGLEEVKQDVQSLINLIQIRKIRQKRKLKQQPMSLHLVFMGNPGTGKTTVARLLAHIYYKLGVLSKGQLVEVDRSGLVGGYVGQTALKVQEVVKKAKGGILFIDEAYSLSSSKSDNDYGNEAIDTLLKAMEDNRDNFIVIVAGYTNLMEEFLESNPGLKSRFNKYIYFKDYNPEELFAIYNKFCNDNKYVMTPDAAEYVKDFLEQRYLRRDDNFANGRDVRNLFEKTLSNQADRLAKKGPNVTNEELSEIILSDVEGIKLKD